MLKTSKLNAALEYAARGWHVLPLKANKKDPHFDLIKKAYLSATTDTDLIKFWYEVDPKANLGIAAMQSGLVILDIDRRNGGELTDLFNETYTVETSDGFHLYYKAPLNANFKGSIFGVDIKYKGYVAGAPSIHPSGHVYKVIKDIEVNELSDELLQEISK